MRKAYDEVELVFERSRDNEGEVKSYPYVRRVTLHLYGSESAEECIGVARQQQNLPADTWNVVSVTGKGL